MTADILTAIDQAVAEYVLLERIQARAARPGMAAYPHAGYRTDAAAVAAEQEAIRAERAGWRPRAFTKVAAPPRLHPRLARPMPIVIPPSVDSSHLPHRAPPPDDEHAGEQAADELPPGFLCGCSRCRFAEALTHPVGDVSDGQPLARPSQRSRWARITAIFRRRP